MNRKKLAAPIVITLILCVIFVGYMVLYFILPIPFVFKVVLALILILLTGVSLFVLAERIHEIKSGEEDDLDKY